jgi:hypothetical protein
MFDPVIERILQLIRAQLVTIRNCEAIYLVGGFSESKYLQTRIKQEFYQSNINIIFLERPSTAIVEGGELFLYYLSTFILLTNYFLQFCKAVKYGLMLDKLEDTDTIKTISPRVFEKTYGKL